MDCATIFATVSIRVDIFSVQWHPELTSSIFEISPEVFMPLLEYKLCSLPLPQVQKCAWLTCNPIDSLIIGQGIF